MLVRLIYLVLLAVLARFLMRALSEWVGQSQGRVSGREGHGEPRTLHRGAMVRDPVCGLNLPQDRALREVVRGERVYFCSEKCRDQFREASS